MNMNLKYPSPLKKYSGGSGPGATSPVTAVGTGSTSASSISVDDRYSSTINCENLGDEICKPMFVLEKHITVIRKGPTAPPALEMFPFDEGVDLINTAVDGAIIDTSFTGDRMWQTSNFLGYSMADPPNTNGIAFDGQDISMFYGANKQHLVTGDNVNVPINLVATGEDWQNNDEIIIELQYTDSMGSTSLATARLQIIEANADPTSAKYGTDWSRYWVTVFTPLPIMVNQTENYIFARIMSITGNFPQDATTDSDLYNVSLVQKPAIFELKFPKFAYRYKYKDGEYSVFGPWSEIAFIPGDFDYMPKKGYNLGMQNKLRELKIKNWRPKNIPKDVVEIDILYKESNSSNIYTVSSHKKNDPPESSAVNYWNSVGTNGDFGNYAIKSELIHKVVASNQLLRPWDNVPRKALAQEVTANRLIFANYVQNFDLKDQTGVDVIASFDPSIDSLDFSVDSSSPMPGSAGKSLKSMRTYQLGVVYRGRYGRETPVLTSKSGSLKISKEKAKLQNRLSVKLNNNPPYWAESYTFYIKETSNEYYNLAMDRWYDAEDGGIWLSFPSSERNKITDRTNLILKKQHDKDVFTDYDTKYKVLSIKDNAPTFIKTSQKYWGSLPMMLYPPGWGVGGRPGNWDTGMFHNSGLPLPNRMFLDIYAEYWDQSSLAELSSMAGGQIRIVQSLGKAGAYNAQTSDTTNKTHWYDISKISRIGSPPQTQQVEVNGVTTEVEIPGQTEQLVRISLEKVFGDDAAFCEPTDNLSLALGLSLEAQTKIVRDKSEFEGRFFVKVLRDANIESNIVLPQKTQEDKYQILFTKKLKYINAAQPGIQDWAYQTPDDGSTTGTVTSFDNYIPAAIKTHTIPNSEWYPANGSVGGVHPGVTKFTQIGVNNTLHGIQETFSNMNLVSSLSPKHANKSAIYNHPIIEEVFPFVNISGMPTPEGPLWPFGPGVSAVGAYSSGGSFDSLMINLGTHRHPFLPPYQGSYNVSYSTAGKVSPWNPFFHTAQRVTRDGNDWPSFVGGISPLAGQHNPYVEFLDETPSLGPTFGGSRALNCIGPYQNRVQTNIVDRSVLELQTSGRNTAYVPNITSWEDNNFLQGANSYQMPAVWGTQVDLLNTRDPAILADGIHSKGNFWAKDTIEKLREDWYYLFWGRDEVDDSWPLGIFSPQRWIIDKAGAAAGYAGNGIWDDGNVGYMDISYYGIGSWKKNYRGNSFMEIFDSEQQNEHTFGKALLTVGTQFRFRYDPDQIVYTITRSQSAEVFNYEAPQGEWGYKPDPTGATPQGGSQLGYHTYPSWGTPSWQGGRAYISDLYNHTPPLTGAASFNKRIRITLTLDKIIGAEGVHKFHPLTNHVDEDGRANIERGRAKYSTDLSQTATHIIPSKGGTPEGVEFYNLNSYWNATNGSTSTPPIISAQGGGLTEQPEYTDAGYAAAFPGLSAQTWYADNPNAYIGLHERGLNDTEIQIITPYKGEEEDTRMSDNPAIWETEPLEDVGLDIYYAASPAYPVTLERYRHDNTLFGPDDEDTYGANWYDYSSRGNEVIKVGSIAQNMGSDPGNSCPECTDSPAVCHVKGNTVWLSETNIDGSAFHDGTSAPRQLIAGDKIRFVWQGEGRFYGVARDDEYIEFEIDQAISFTSYKLKNNTHNYKRGLGYFNCWSYNNGVESNRVRDDFNAITIDKGVKASMPLATPYEEERRTSGLIFSGIYNSTSGINSTNQFIQAEPITKDINPINGSIQKLFARDTDLLTFCETKVFKILAKKDALFNANGNTNITSNNAVLGQAMPFSGEYGISKNPESFASESYRVYFTDKNNGAVLRLSKDGLTPISDAGMKDWFKDNLKSATSLIGSHDDRDDQYNLTIETADQDGNEKAYTVSYTEARRGWVSFKSFIQQDGISHKNVYYTTPSNKYSRIDINDPWGVSYAIPAHGAAETWQHYLDLIIKRSISTDVNSSPTVIVNNGAGTIVKGMVVEGNGIPIDTVVNSVICTSVCVVTLSNSCFLEANDELTFTTARNSFYDIPNHYSMLKVLFNGAQGTVKRFKTLDYEGTQARTLNRFSEDYKLLDDSGVSISVGRSIENYPKIGWYVDDIETDMQEGKVPEFIDKENKWFNYIRGFEDAGIHDSIDTGEFSLQGLGFADDLPPCIVSYKCGGSGACYDPGDGTGDYTSISECIIGCTSAKISFDCIGGACIDPGTGLGFYSDLAACSDYCGGIAASFTCDPIIGCFDPGTGLGIHSTFAACKDACSAYGCTDPTACNYSSLAHFDDGSCILPDGCTDSLACNYDSDAVCDDGSCTHKGCTDSTALNYDEDAGCDDGSCTYPIFGCTDPLAIINYDAAATVDDGSCIYGGCTDPTANNFDFPSDATHIDDGSCIYDPGLIPCSQDFVIGEGAQGLYNVDFKFGASFGACVITFEVGNADIAGSTNTEKAVPDKLKWTYSSSVGSEYSAVHMGDGAGGLVDEMRGMGYMRGMIGGYYDGNIPDRPISLNAGTLLTAATSPTDMVFGAEYPNFDATIAAIPPPMPHGTIEDIDGYTWDDPFTAYTQDGTPAVTLGPYTGKNVTEIPDYNGQIYKGSSAFTGSNNDHATRQAMMVVPVNGGIINIQIEAPFAGTWHQVQVNCPITLPKWGNGDFNCGTNSSGNPYSTKMEALAHDFGGVNNITAYHLNSQNQKYRIESSHGGHVLSLAPNAAGGTAYEGVVNQHDWVFLDSHGHTKMYVGWYAIQIASTVYAVYVGADASSYNSASSASTEELGIVKTIEGS